LFGLRGKVLSWGVLGFKILMRRALDRGLAFIFKAA